MDLFLMRETLRMAGRALVANRMRSMLALLGIVIGVMTIITMVALVNGLQRSVAQSIQSLGNNTIYIRRIRPGVHFNNDIPDSLKQRRAFTMEDGRAILAQAPAVKAVSPLKWPWQDMRLEYRNKKTRFVQVYGTNESYVITNGYEVVHGRFFTAEEVERRASLCVIGRETRETLFANSDPLGRTVHLSGVPYTVIGEFGPKGKLFGQNLDELVVVPYTTIDKHFPAPNDVPPWFPKRGELFLDAVPQTPELSAVAQQQIIEVLRVRRHLPSNKGNDFVVMTDDVFVSLFQQLTGGIVLVMMLVSSISLLVGGIGVMNIMLVAVTERTREVGIRKALGAPRRAILTQFLLEAILLTAGGGALGVFLGWIISQSIKAATRFPTFVSPWSVVVGVLFSAMVGVFFGLYPAMRASRLDPVDSLRYE
jgi:putative ABC transport system permease protein